MRSKNREKGGSAAFLRMTWIGLLAGGSLAAAALQAQVNLGQLTHTTGSTGTNFDAALTPSGSRIVFESDRDLTGGNADLSREIVLWSEGGTVTQLTTSFPGCFSTRATIDSAGRRVAFNSNCNLTGSNTDGNHEIFLWTEGTGLTPITQSLGGDGAAGASISADGKRIAFSSDRDFTGGNADLSFEIFLWIEGRGFLQLTQSSGAESFDVSANADGSRVAFASDGNLTGANADRSFEVFLWIEGAGLTQLTDATGGSSSRPSINGAGTRIAFESDRDLTGGNSGLTEQIFLWKQGGGISQLTKGNGDFTRMASVDAAGTAIAFASNSDLTGGNSGRVEQIFLWTEGAGLSQITASSLGSTRRPSVSAGAARIAFDSDADLVGQNGDLNTELFLATALPPAAPSGLSVKVLSRKQAELRWVDNAVNETQIEVELRRGSGAFLLAKSLPRNATSTLLTGLQPNTRYAVRLRCRNAAGTSRYSARVVFTTPR